MEVGVSNEIKYQSLIYSHNEPLFLKPDGVRTRYCIGWNGYGRYLPNTLKVTYNGLPCNISEESNGLFYNFEIAPGSNTNYEDYKVSYITRPLDYAFSTGDPLGGYPGEEYFLFPNWNNALGEGDGFWIGKWPATYNGNTIPLSKSGMSDIWRVVLIDNAIYYSKAKGEGFNIVRNRRWVSIALWCDHHNIYVNGNIYGNAYNLDGNGTTLSDCGGGFAHHGYNFVTGPNIPDSWNHNGKSNGIKHLAGNVFEFMDGIENRSGKIYVYDENNQYVDSGIDITANVSDRVQIIDISNTTKEILDEGVPNIVSTNGYIPSNLKQDAMWSSNGAKNIIYRGGSADFGVSDGLWAFVSWSGRSEAAYDNTGFRLSRDLI